MGSCSARRIGSRAPRSALPHRPRLSRLDLGETVRLSHVRSNWPRSGGAFCFANIDLRQQPSPSDRTGRLGTLSLPTVAQTQFLVSARTFRLWSGDACAGERAAGRLQQPRHLDSGPLAPRAAGMPRSSRPAAMARSDSPPATARPYVGGLKNSMRWRRVSGR